MKRLNEKTGKFEDVPKKTVEELDDQVRNCRVKQIVARVEAWNLTGHFGGVA